MKFLILSIIAFFSFLVCSAQILLKGSAVSGLVLLNFDYFANSGTLGTEIKCKRIGLEYCFNHFNYLGDVTYWSNTNQVAFKYYFIDKPDTIVKAFHWYASPFMQHKYMVDHEDTYMRDYGLIQNASGIGYGFLIGGTKDLNKNFGWEHGIYCYYLSVYKHVLQGQAYKIFGNLESGFNYGIRIYIYFKINYRHY